MSTAARQRRCRRARTYSAISARAKSSQLAGGALNLLLDTTLNISSFGEDEAGEIYVVGLGGTVHRIASESPASTTTTLATSGTPVPAGALVTFTATVTGSSPTGNVNFVADGAAPLAGCSAVALTGTGNSRTATCPNSSLAVGVHSIVASYAGDAANMASSSAPLSQVINSPLLSYTLSGIVQMGGVGLSGVSFAASGTGATCTVSDASGNYSCTVPQGYTGNVTPSRAGYSFTPNALSYSNVAANQSGQYFAASTSINVALQANGGLVSASSAYSGWAATNAIDGNRQSGSFAAWIDANPDSFPDWLQVNFSGVQSIGEIDVFTFTDGYPTPVEPTPTMTFGLYGITDFHVQYWSNGAWVDVPGGNVTGNNLVWRKLTFTPISTDRIRVLVNAGLFHYSRITELEAWTAPATADTSPPSTPTNLAASAVTATGATLSWTAATDDVAVVGYKVFRDGTQVGTPTATTFVDSGLAPSTTYNYTVSAFDAAGHDSAPSSPPLAVTTPAASASINVALQANGGLVSASSAYSGWAATNAIDGNRQSGSFAAWIDANPDSFPDWLQVNFSGVQSIGEIDVFTFTDGYPTPAEPTPTMTFGLYGITDFHVQYWSNGAWVDVPGGNVTGNNLVWRKLTFTPISTDRIRVLVNAGLFHYSRITELEAWTAPATADTSPPSTPTNLAASAVTATGATLSWTAATDDVAVVGYKVFRDGTQVGTPTATTFVDSGLAPSTTYNYTVSAFDAAGHDSAPSSPPLAVTTPAASASINVALQANGGLVSASSAYSGWAATNAIDGNRQSGSFAAWIDANPDSFPDWLQVNFSGVQSIGEIDVFTFTDGYPTPAEPTPTMTFGLYGITDFHVQYWSNGAWVDVPGGNVTGNNLVWRKLTFTPISTDRIRVLVNAGLFHYSRITELEAWTAPPTPDTSPPSTPTNLAASAVTATGATLSWTAATDDVAVVGYKVFRDGTQVGTPTATTFVDAGLSPSTTYNYTVSAFDPTATIRPRPAHRWR